MGYTAHVLLYHLAAICTPAQRKAPFLECDFVVGSITGEPSWFWVDATTGTMNPLRRGALSRMISDGNAVDLRDGTYGNSLTPIHNGNERVWFFGRQAPALMFLASIAAGTWFELTRKQRVLVGPRENVLCRVAAARLARTMTSDAVEFGLLEAAAAAEVAYALAVHPPTQTAWPGATRDRELYNLVGRAYAVSGRHGPVNPELFEPQADRSSRDVIPNFGDYLA